MKKYKIVCYYPSDMLAVLEQVEKDDRTKDCFGIYDLEKHDWLKLGNG